MRILIIGEYSGFANNLSHGFSKLGHDSVVITAGDGTKRIPHESKDIVLNKYKDFRILGIRVRYSWVIRTYFANRRFNREFVKENKFDLIYIINSEFVYDRISNTVNRGIAFSNLKEGRLLNYGGAIILSCCGDDPAFNIYSRELDNNPFLNSKPMAVFSRHSVIQLYDKIIRISSFLHTTAYGYYYCIQKYLKEKNITKSIVSSYLPFSVPKTYESNRIGSRIVVYHGLLRSEAKGSPEITKAMRALQNKYPDRVDCIIKEKLPYSDYLNILQSCNILVDQAAGDGFGMNTCNGLSRGKVVLCAVSDKTSQLMGGSVCPIVSINRDVQDIYQKLENLILNPDIIKRVSTESRQFAEDFLSDEVVAGKLISCLNNNK